MVGSLGFTIEFGILVALVHGANWSPFLARAVAMAAAFFCTWLHRYWTFPGRVRSPLPRSLLYGTCGVWRSYPVLAAAVGSVSPAVSVTFSPNGLPSPSLANSQSSLRDADAR